MAKQWQYNRKETRDGLSINTVCHQIQFYKISCNTICVCNYFTIVYSVEGNKTFSTSYGTEVQLAWPVKSEGTGQTGLEPGIWGVHTGDPGGCGRGGGGPSPCHTRSASLPSLCATQSEEQEGGLEVWTAENVNGGQSDSKYEYACLCLRVVSSAVLHPRLHLHQLLPPLALTEHSYWADTKTQELNVHNCAQEILLRKSADMFLPQ